MVGCFPGHCFLNFWNKEKKRNIVTNPSSAKERELFHLDSLLGQDTPPISSCLQRSQIMYSLTALRDIVKDHEKTFNPNPKGKDPREGPLVSFSNPQFIYTQFQPEDTFFESTKLKSPMDSKGILKFVEENRKWLTQAEGEYPAFVETGDNTVPLFMETKLADLGSKFNSQILEYDDEFAEGNLAETQLVYAVIVNRTEKRIVVVFRGSVTPKDYAVDANFTFHCPAEIKSFTDRKVEIHSGFSDYLMTDIKEEGEKSKLDQIIEVLKEVYAYKDEEEDYSTYDLYVTGHSLGGSLTQLLAFLLAGMKETEFIPKPIVAVSFASPVVGNKEFFLAYQDLEKERKLRHIRISNENDIVPGTPGLGYMQTGVNIHVQDKKAEVGYTNTKTIISQMSPNFIARHSLEGDKCYANRIYKKDAKSDKLLNSDILSMSINELYENYAHLEKNV